MRLPEEIWFRVAPSRSFAIPSISTGRLCSPIERGRGEREENLGAVAGLCGGSIMAPPPLGSPAFRACRIAGTEVGWWGGRAILDTVSRARP